MALRPRSKSVFHVGEMSTLEKRREDVVGKVKGASGRSQKGEGCQLNSTPNAKSTFLHRNGCLDPGRIVRTKLNISYRADNRSEPLIVLLEAGGEETGLPSMSVNELCNYK